LHDFHIHTTFSNDAHSGAEAMAKAAVRAGLDGIAVTDHFDPFFQGDRFPWDLDTEGYTAMLLELESEFAERLTVAKGVELGMLKGAGLRECERFVESFPFDFVIASVHGTTSAPLHEDGFLAGKTTAQVNEEYYSALLECIRNFKNYDVLGHLNVIDRYAKEFAPASVYMPFAEEIMRQAISVGKGIEVNTSSYRYKMERGTPPLDILRRFRELGGEIVTIGSDAHDTTAVGTHLDEAVQMMKEAGFTHYAVFCERKPEFVALP